MTDEPLLLITMLLFQLEMLVQGIRSQALPVQVLQGRNLEENQECIKIDEKSASLHVHPLTRPVRLLNATSVEISLCEE
jgi:hypothetical protein